MQTMLLLMFVTLPSPSQARTDSAPRTMPTVRTAARSLQRAAAAEIARAEKELSAPAAGMVPTPADLERLADRERTLDVRLTLLAQESRYQQAAAARPGTAQAAKARAEKAAAGIRSEIDATLSSRANVRAELAVARAAVPPSAARRAELRERLDLLRDLSKYLMRVAEGDRTEP